MSKLISIDPPLLCQFLVNCPNPTGKAIVWAHSDLGQPVRWIMMPVCDNCLSAAKAAYKVNAQSPPSAPSLTQIS